MYNQKLDIVNIGTWFKNERNKVFRFYFYKKIFTPKEMKECSINEAVYENDGYPFLAYIMNIIEIPGDLLLELMEYDDSEDEEYQEMLRQKRHYYRLSDVKMELYYLDQPGTDE